ncbi:MAG: hypothetical protein IJ679_04490, partial [Lachnospiraceae bacterium]|nr:hypothetical protein [Lachnospiraceae bacterium]
PGSFDRFFGIAWFEGFVRDAGVCGGRRDETFRCVAISFLTGGCSDAESKPGGSGHFKAGSEMAERAALRSEVTVLWDG